MTPRTSLHRGSPGRAEPPASHPVAPRPLGYSSRLHADPVFVAQMAAARKEIEAARAAGVKSPLNCAAEAQALVGGP